MELYTVDESMVETIPFIPIELQTISKIEKFDKMDSIDSTESIEPVQHTIIQIEPLNFNLDLDVESKLFGKQNLDPFDTKSRFNCCCTSLNDEFHYISVNMTLCDMLSYDVLTKHSHNVFKWRGICHWFQKYRKSDRCLLSFFFYSNWWIVVKLSMLSYIPLTLFMIIFAIVMPRGTLVATVFEIYILFVCFNIFVIWFLVIIADITGKFYDKYDTIFKNNILKITEIVVIEDSSVTWIPYHFLENYINLTKFNMAKLTKIIGIDCNFMNNCQNLVTFDTTGLTNLITIKQNFMNGCTSLTELNTSGLISVCRISDNFMCGCTSLVKFNALNLSNVQFIGSNFMNGCSSLTRFDASNWKNVSIIHSSFLFNCNKLFDVDLSGLSSLQQFGTLYYNLEPNYSFYNSSKSPKLQIYLDPNVKYYQNFWLYCDPYIYTKRYVKPVLYLDNICVI